jgi:ubiquinone/menaquinone biosynthesis C-methylase UbiE
MNHEKELAYRYDLLISTDWRDRFDSLINEHIKLPTEGRILDVNCGTGEHAIELAEQIRGKGDVIAVDPSPDRIEIALAKALAKKLDDVTFEVGDGCNLRFPDNDFDAVIGDASMLETEQIECLFAEMRRVADSDAPVVLKLATHGSFDEFFSIYWEALMNLGLVDSCWNRLENFINERITVSDAEKMAAGVGLRHVVSYVEKETFDFATAQEFIESPLIQDIFLDTWLSIVPEAEREKIVREIISIIERERHHESFDISIKATLIKGVK